MGPIRTDADEAANQPALLDLGFEKALLEQLNQGVCIVDGDHRIVYWNAAAERISGYPAHEVAGQFSHGDLLMHAETNQFHMPEGADTHLALLRRREGYRVLVKLTSRPIRDAAGMLVGALELFHPALAHHVPKEGERGQWIGSDPVAPAGNRPYGEMMLRHALEIWNTCECPFGWLRIGLDGAEELDSRYGHGMLAAALRMVAATLDGNLGLPDIVTRWEALEFRVLVRRCTRLDLAAVAERLRMLVGASTLEWWGDRLRVTVSIGAASVECGDTMESLEQRAGQVFESCRASGGDRVALAHSMGSRTE